MNGNLIIVIFIFFNSNFSFLSYPILGSENMFEKYRVKANDNLEDIAKKFRTNKAYIEDLNNLVYDESLREGMDIIVPKAREKYFDTYTINKGDNLYAISKKYNINPTLLAALNGLDSNDYIYPNQVLLLPVGNYSYYITKDGDTLDIVSDMFNKNKDEIIRENNTIYLLPGQVLVSKRK